MIREPVPADPGPEDPAPPADDNGREDWDYKNYWRAVAWSKMKDRWHISKTYFGYNNLSEDRKKECISKIRNKTIQRYKDFNNKQNNIFLKVLFDDGNVMYFHSYHTAAKTLLIDRGAIKYALNHNNGRIFKIKAVFTIISKEEYINTLLKK